MGKHSIPRNGWPRKAAAVTGAAIVTGLFVAGSSSSSATAAPNRVMAMANTPSLKASTRVLSVSGPVPGSGVEPAAADPSGECEMLFMTGNIQ